MNTLQNKNGTQITTGSVLKLLSAILFIIIVFAAGCPRYKVYEAEMTGRAELARAEGNRQIAIKEANAKRDAAKALAEADTIRAHGVAMANKIIGNSLRGNEMYLHYLWLQSLEQGNNEVIYIPTEANFPVMEAGRFNKQWQKKIEADEPQLPKPKE